MAVKASPVGTIAGMKKSLKRGGGGQFLQRVSKDGITVRFLEEPDTWIKYQEHYDENHEPRYFPCSDDCEGCARGLDKSKRYLVNALDRTENKVVPLVLPTSLVTNLMKKYDRFNTMLDRDYELSKEGDGFDTTYDALYDQPSSVKGIQKFELLDLMSILEGMLGDDDDDDEGEDEAPKVVRRRPGGAAKKTAARKRPRVVEDEDDDYEPTPRKRVAKKTVAKRTIGKPPVKTVKKTVAKKTIKRR